MGLKNLLRRKLITFLTTLGIIIGTVSIVVMVSIGIGMQEQMSNQMKQFGSLEIITVNVPVQSSYSQKNQDKKYIQESDIETFKNIEGVQGATPVVSYSTQMLTGEQLVANVTIKGMSIEFLKHYGLDKVEDGGKPLTKDTPYGVIFGRNTLYNFKKSGGEATESEMDYYDMVSGTRKPPKFKPIGTRIYMSFGSGPMGSEGSSVQPVPITAVGVLKTKGFEKASYAFMEISRLEELKRNYDKMTGYSATGGKIPKQSGYTEALLYVPDKKYIKSIQSEIVKLGFKPNSMEQMLNQNKSFTNIINMVFGGIGGISLLVAAIGITNTMVMAIYERRKEIGVMKVIGASIKDIKRLFLFESASIGLFGGMLGIITSFLISGLINIITSSFSIMGQLEDGVSPKLSVIPLWLVGASLLFTAMIGLISGYMPAKKATKLSALEAIKTE